MIIVYGSIGIGFFIAVITAIVAFFFRRSSRKEIKFWQDMIVEDCGLKYFPDLSRRTLTAHDVVAACEKASGVHDLGRHDLVRPLLVVAELEGRQFFLPGAGIDYIALDVSDTPAGNDQNI